MLLNSFLKNTYLISSVALRLQRGMQKWQCVPKRILYFLADRFPIGNLNFWIHTDGLSLGATSSINANWQETRGSERMTANTVELTQKNHPSVRLSVPSKGVSLGSVIATFMAISVFHRSLLSWKKTTTNHYKPIPQTQIYKRLIWCPMIVNFIRKEWQIHFYKIILHV